MKYPGGFGPRIPDAVESILWRNSPLSEQPAGTNDIRSQVTWVSFTPLIYALLYKRAF